VTPALPGRPLGGVGSPHAGFSRFRVLDFSKLLPGPYATQVLRDMGMKVTRVELPFFADLSREFPPKIAGVGALYWMINQGKKELFFDYRSGPGRKRIEKLIKSSDVLVEGFRPGRMAKFGLGYEDVRKLNPRLVYCSISGYGDDDRRAGHDLNFLAESGVLGMGDSRGNVAFPSAQFADLAGSMAAVSGIVAALLERERTRRGRRVSVSMAQAVHSWLAIPLSYSAATGREPGVQWWNGAHPFYGLYETKDGKRLAVGAVESGFALGLLDLLGLAGLRDLAAEPLKNAAPLRAALARAFKAETLSVWKKRLTGKDVCVSPVYGLGEASERMSPLKPPARTKKP
jgi:alpha-methylacyl-CoA racemase